MNVLRLLSVLLLLSVPVLLAAAALCCAAESRFRPFREPFARFLRLPRPAQVFVVCFVLAFVVYGSTKRMGNGKWRMENGRATVQRDAGEASSPPVALTQDQIDAGFALTRVGTNETWDFSAPDGAHVHAPWILRGASEDRFDIHSSADRPLRLLFGGGEIDGLTVSSTGVLLPKPPDSPVVPHGRLADLVPDGTNVAALAGVLAPLRTFLGLVPEANWGLLPESARPSEAWWFVTPSNSVVVTWRNALLGRSVDTAASFQVEMFADGGFVYRYDLSRAGLWNGEPVTNVLVGAFNGGKGETLDVASVTNLTSVFWHALSPDDTPTGDRDGDGLSTAEEIFIHGTDPGLPDTDGDGLPDGEEIARGTDPLSRDVPDADILARVAASATNEAFQAALVVSTNSLVSWRLFDGFAADLILPPSQPSQHSQLLYERTFAVGRSSAWQQYFLS
ncbi:MAG: hypothetical protein Q4G65_12935, partial [bacterium]|nr:hypothetical protein [bacterium]